MKAVFHSSSLSQACRGNRTRPTSNGNMHMRAHTPRSGLIIQVVINTSGVLVYLQMCCLNRVFKENNCNFKHAFFSRITILHRHAYQTLKSRCKCRHLKSPWCRCQGRLRSVLCAPSLSLKGNGGLGGFIPQIQMSQWPQFGHVTTSFVMSSEAFVVC